MDNSLIKLLIRSEQVIARLLEAKKEDPAERSFFRFGAEDIPLALEYVQNQLCTPKTDFDTPEEMFSTIDTSILFTLVYNAVYGVQDNQAIVPEYDGGQWICDNY